MHTLFSGSLCRICLKHTIFGSSVDDIAGFQMIYIINLFDRFLLLFDKVTYQSWEHMDSLILGFLCRTCVKYYSFDFDSSVDDSVGFQMKD
jgi:hypothetical protein